MNCDSDGVGFDFDRVVARAGSGSLKYDARRETFGRADVIPLWVADMDFAAPPAVTEALMARAAHPVYGYHVVPEGIYQALIDWLRQRHGWQVEREWIVLCPGVVPSLYAAVPAFAAPGEAVIVQPPVYFPFFSAVTDTGRTLLENPLCLTGAGYAMDFDHLEACAARARLLLLCSPHNPVGRVWRREELARLLEIAREYDLTVLSDEIHADLVYPGQRHIPLAVLAGDAPHIVTAVAPSKTFNIPGLGLSALVVPDTARRRALQEAFETLHVSVANPFSLAAFAAAYRDGGPWLDALLDYLQGTRDFVAAWLAGHLPAIRPLPAEGTYLLWLDCRALGLHDTELRDLFVKQAGVGMSPGPLFGTGGSGFMRMNIGAPRALIAEALQRIKAVISR